ncbi:MAG TPA: ABC transporter ATP-binding protein [Candidatus Eisenbergiella merdavium]|uniref:ABC transporter ATP-binding protein n=1 Tax=Candidatus Eisenbergiella merdavium TaxID=2838551 RepID=A0A9D2NHH8_9FIRM|nr:ABC transporter ATP-binding protein [Candidatus Eisenbergiella merdavium]
MDAIKVQNVSKVYRLYQKPSDRLKEAINIFHKSYHTSFFALNDISFQVKKGETVGIIGTNGSGKSTILKIITGVLKQTTGTVEVNGRVSALLELGAGFDMDYTGIENIYMNGSILGFSKEEMTKKLQEILDFADIGDFVYQPVKTYSSGMLVRLAFALAINVEPEVLIIDEALAVGDAFFQAKCFHKLEEIKKSGVTILFVSHDIVSVKKMCSRAIWIEKGILQDIGDAKSICEKYLSMQIRKQNEEISRMIGNLELDNLDTDIEKGRKKVFRSIHKDHSVQVSGTGEGEIVSFYIKNEDENEVSVLEVEKEYKFGLLAYFKCDISNVLFGFEMENTRGVKLFSVNNFLTNQVVEKAKNGEYIEAVFRVKLPRICKGEYLISPSLARGSQNSHVVVERIHNYQKITVDNQGYNLSVIELDTQARIIEYEKKDVILCEK